MALHNVALHAYVQLSGYWVHIMKIDCLVLLVDKGKQLRYVGECVIT